MRRWLCRRLRGLLAMLGEPTPPALAATIDNLHGSETGTWSTATCAEPVFVPSWHVIHVPRTGALTWRRVPVS